MSEYVVTLTWNGVQASSPLMAAIRFQQLLGDVELPEGTVLTVLNDETGEETEVEL